MLTLEDKFCRERHVGVQIYSIVTYQMSFITAVGILYLPNEAI